MDRVYEHFSESAILGVARLTESYFLYTPEAFVMCCRPLRKTQPVLHWDNC